MSTRSNECFGPEQQHLTEPRSTRTTCNEHSTKCTLHDKIGTATFVERKIFKMNIQDKSCRYILAAGRKTTKKTVAINCT